MLAALFITGVCLQLFADSSYARITALDYRAVVHDEPGGRGKIVVRELLTFDVNAKRQDNLFWELWRDLPEEYTDGVKVEYKVNSVKQIFEDGSAAVFEETPNLYWEDSDYISEAEGYGPGKWHHSKGPYDDERNFECVLFYVDGLYRETVVFEIEYEMYNASLRYADASELYVSLYSGDSIRYLDSLTGQFLFPEALMPGPGNYDAYTYGTNAHSFAFSESDALNYGYHTFSFELGPTELNFRPYNMYVEFALISHGQDKHIFTQHAEENIYYNTDMLPKITQAQSDYEGLPSIYKTAKTAVAAALTALASIFLAVAFSSDNRLRKKNEFHEPNGNIGLFREIPGELDPCFAAALVFCRGGRAADEIRDGYAASMLSLVQKGYIDLDRVNPARGWSASNVKITVLNRAPADEFAKAPETEDPAAEKPLSATEELYYNLLVRHSRGIKQANGYELPLDSFQSRVLQDCEHTDSFVKNMARAVKSVGVSQGYFTNYEYRKLVIETRKKAVRHLIFGLLILFAGNLILYQTRLDQAFGALYILGAGLLACAARYRTFAKKYVFFTRFGADEYDKWRGLYNFLNSETLMKERTVLELALWEHYLIYATAFGISKKVIKALKLRCPEAHLSPVLRNPYIYTRGFYVSSRSFANTTRTASYVSRSGGHGGYGGGGRGGGGGGGGH